MKPILAAILKTADGNFDRGALIGSLIFAILICLFVWILNRALKTGRIPARSGYMGLRTYWMERATRPSGFWSWFVAYCLATAFFSYMIVALCFGLLSKSS